MEDVRRGRKMSDFASRVAGEVATKQEEQSRFAAQVAGEVASGYYCEGVWISLAERGDDECPQCGTSYHADFYRHHGAANKAEGRSNA